MGLRIGTNLGPINVSTGSSSKGGGGYAGLAFLVAVPFWLITTYPIPTILIVAVLVGLFVWFRQNAAKMAREQQLRDAADAQHYLVMQGDDRGTYGFNCPSPDTL